MTTAEAWVEACRGSPSRTAAMARTSLTAGLLSRQFPEARLHLQGLLQGDVQFLRHQLGDLVHFRVRHFQGPAHVPDHLAGLHAAEGGDLGHVLPAVGLGDVVDDLAPALVTEVHVDIRRAHPLRIEEALEEEAVGQGVQVGDPQGIGHQAAGGGAPARTHGDPVPLGIIDDIGHHQEIAGKAHLHQDVDLEFQALPVGLLRRPGVGGGDRQAGREPLPGHAGHELFHALALGLGVNREAVGAQVQADVAAGRDLGGGGQGRRVRDGPGHLLRALEIELIGLELHAAGAVDRPARLDAEQGILGPGVLRA